MDEFELQKFSFRKNPIKFEANIREYSFLIWFTNMHIFEIDFASNMLKSLIRSDFCFIFSLV